MRSFIIIEVEHGEDTDPLESFASYCSDPIPQFDGLTIMDYAVRVAVQPFMTAVSINSIIDRGTGQEQ